MNHIYVEVESIQNIHLCETLPGKVSWWRPVQTEGYSAWVRTSRKSETNAAGAPLDALEYVAAVSEDGKTVLHVVVPTLYGDNDPDVYDDLLRDIEDRIAWTDRVGEMDLALSLEINAHFAEYPFMHIKAPEEIVKRLRPEGLCQMPSWLVRDYEKVLSSYVREGTSLQPTYLKAGCWRVDGQTGCMLAPETVCKYQDAESIAAFMNEIVTFKKGETELAVRPGVLNGVPGVVVRTSDLSIEEITHRAGQSVVTAAMLDQRADDETCFMFLTDALSQASNFCVVDLYETALETFAPNDIRIWVSEYDAFLRLDQYSLWAFVPEEQVSISTARQIANVLGAGWKALQAKPQFGNEFGATVRAYFR